MVRNKNSGLNSRGDSTVSTQTDAAEAEEDMKSAECPACLESELQHHSTLPHPICSACGYVIGSDAGVPAAPSDKGSTNTSGADSWTEHYTVTNSTKKQIASALTKLEALSDELLLSEDTRDEVARVYASAAVENLTDGRPTALIVAASICIGSREAGVPRPSDRVAQVAEFPPGKVKQAIRRFQEELDRGYTGGSPAEYVHYLCDDLGVEDSIKDHAIEAAETFEENGGQQELHPAGVAGAAIYLSIDGALSQREIAAAIGVSKETIRLRVADFREVIPQ